jgi:uncharacterized membrane protein
MLSRRRELSYVVYSTLDAVLETVLASERRFVEGFLAGLYC